MMMDINLYIYIIYLFILLLLSLAAAATEAATPVGCVVRYGLFRISAPVTPSTSLRVAALSLSNYLTPILRPHPA
jgi:hypothetical protein